MVKFISITTSRENSRTFQEPRIHGFSRTNIQVWNNLFFKFKDFVTGFSRTVGTLMRLHHNACSVDKNIPMNMCTITCTGTVHVCKS